jgi:hypothetical protein
MQLYLRDLYLGTYYLYYMFRPIWAIFMYHVYKNVKSTKKNMFYVIHELHGRPSLSLSLSLSIYIYIYIYIYMYRYHLPL